MLCYATMPRYATMSHYATMLLALILCYPMNTTTDEYSDRWVYQFRIERPVIKLSSLRFVFALVFAYVI